jgi:tRNA threonylcarbamoyl adenosine modification protein (Sua5/YciO/YrdC/YwlC family)
MVLRSSTIIRINPRRISREAMSTAGEILRRGGLVAFPTETVYGLGANALDGQAVGKVFQVKGRPADKPLIVLAHNLQQLRRLVDEIPPWARTLMSRFWPDGLTLILPASPAVPRQLLAGGTAIAVRISGHSVVRALLEAAQVPLTAPSANRSGNPAPADAEAVQRELGGRVDLIIDGGPSPVTAPSTILDVRAEPVQLIRQGRIPLADIRKLMPVEEADRSTLVTPATVLLVCTGNTCRSAMAQGLLRKMLSARGVDGISIRSAGTRAMKGQPASALAQQVARAEDEVDLGQHRAQPLTNQLLEEADLILAMTLSHARQIEAMGRWYARKTYLLTSFPRSQRRDPEDIEDPMGGSAEVYLRVYRRIKKQLERVVDVLAGGKELKIEDFRF